MILDDDDDDVAGIEVGCICEVDTDREEAGLDPLRAGGTASDNG